MLEHTHRFLMVLSMPSAFQSLVCLLVLFRHIEFLHLATYKKQKQKNGMDWSTTLLETCLVQLVKLGRLLSLLDAPCHTTTPSVMHTLAYSIRLSC